jgi:hypothetical protein
MDEEDADRLVLNNAHFLVHHVLSTKWHYVPVST